MILERNFTKCPFRNADEWGETCNIVENSTECSGWLTRPDWCPFNSHPEITVRMVEEEKE